jgi:hypothetical protein
MQVVDARAGIRRLVVGLENQSPVRTLNLELSTACDTDRDTDAPLPWLSPEAVRWMSSESLDI